MWGIFYNDIVTLYNRYIDIDTGREIWLPTVLDNVNLINTQGANIAKNGIKEADKVKLSIMKNTLIKPYVEPIAWQKLSKEEKAETFTFTPSTDFFVKGDKSDVIIDEYAHFENMHENYDGVYRITTVDDYADVLPHWEIGGV